MSESVVYDQIQIFLDETKLLYELQSEFKVHFFQTIHVDSFNITLFAQESGQRSFFKYGLTYSIESTR